MLFSHSFARGPAPVLPPPVMVNEKLSFPGYAGAPGLFRRFAGGDGGRDHPMGEQRAHTAGTDAATSSVAKIRDRLKLPPRASFRPRQPKSPKPARQATPPAGAAGAKGSLSARMRRHLNRDGPNTELGFLINECLTLPRSVLLASLFVNVLGLALPLTILQVYDRILPHRSTDTLLLLSLGLLGVFAVEALLKIARSYVMGWSAVKQGYRAEMGALIRHLKARQGEVDRTPAALWMDAFDAVGELNAFHGGNARLIIVDLPMAAVFLIVTALVGGFLVLVPIALIAGFGCFAALKSKDLQTVLSHRTDQDNKRYDFLVECLEGIHTIKGLAMEPQMQRRFERLQKSSSMASYDTISMGNKLQTIGSLFANSTMILVVSVGATMVMYGDLSIGSLACCSLLSGRLIQPVLRGIGVWTELQNIELAQTRAKRFDDLDVLGAAAAEAQADMRGEIVFSHAGYRQEGVRKLHFEDISLEIGTGEMIGLRGEKDSGCTTFARLIIGDAVPTSGAVTIDGLDASGAHRAALRRRISYVAADAVSFKGTILENISMFGAGEKLEAARGAARLIGLEEDIHRLPNGYDTPLAQGVSDTFSSGFMQRIAIARAVAQEPKILILDEANTLLDMRSDALLREGLTQLKGEVTSVLISNRPSLLQISDRVFELREGRLHRLADTGHAAAAEGDEAVPEGAVA